MSQWVSQSQQTSGAILFFLFCIFIRCVVVAESLARSVGRSIVDVIVILIQQLQPLLLRWGAAYSLSVGWGGHPILARASLLSLSSSLGWWCDEIGSFCGIYSMKTSLYSFTINLPLSELNLVAHTHTHTSSVCVCVCFFFIYILRRQRCSVCNYFRASESPVRNGFFFSSSSLTLDIPRNVHTHTTLWCIYIIIKNIKKNSRPRPPRLPPPPPPTPFKKKTHRAF